MTSCASFASNLEWHGTAPVMADARLRRIVNGIFYVMRAEWLPLALAAKRFATVGATPIYRWFDQEDPVHRRRSLFLRTINHGALVSGHGRSRARHASDAMPARAARLSTARCLRQDERTRLVAPAATKMEGVVGQDGAASPVCEIKGRNNAARRHALVDTAGGRGHAGQLPARGAMTPARRLVSRTAMPGTPVAGRSDLCEDPHAARFRSSRRSLPTAATPATSRQGRHRPP